MAELAINAIAPLVTVDACVETNACSKCYKVCKGTKKIGVNGENIWLIICFN